LGETRDAYRLLLGTPDGTRLLGRSNEGKLIILRWNLGDVDGGDGLTGLVWLRLGTSGELFIKCWEVLEWL
jgi:hypothetical protein